MPIDYANYPKEWRAISKHIRFERAQGRCECKGECGISHEGDRCPRLHGAQIAHFSGNDSNASRVLLTVAHTCHDPLCTNPDHLRAMCQRCHLRYDRQHHARNAGRTRRRKRIASGQIALLEEDP